MDDLTGTFPEIHLLQVSACFSADRKKVHTLSEYSGTSRTATVELSLEDGLGAEITKSLILGIIEPQLNFTLHIGKGNPVAPIRLVSRLLDGDSTEMQRLSINVSEA